MCSCLKQTIASASPVRTRASAALVRACASAAPVQLVLQLHLCELVLQLPCASVCFSCPVRARASATLCELVLQLPCASFSKTCARSCVSSLCELVLQLPVQRAMAELHVTEDTAFRITSPNDCVVAIVGDYCYIAEHRGKPIFGSLCMTIDRVWYHAPQLTDR